MDYDYYYFYYNPCYCECYHSTQPNDIDDCMVGIGLSAAYRSELPPAFNEATWQWIAETGNSVGDPATAQYTFLMFPPMTETAGVNGYPYVYEDYNDPIDGIANAWCDYWVHFLYAEMPNAYFEDGVNSVESSVDQGFYYPPWCLYHYMHGETQVPPGYFPGNTSWCGDGWSFLTAWKEY